MEGFTKYAELISYTSMVAPLAAVLVYIIFQPAVKITWIIVMMCALSLLFDLANEFVVRYYGVGIVMANVYYILNFFLVIWLYDQLLGKNGKILIYGSLVVFFILVIVDSEFFMQMTNVHSLVWSGEGVLTVILAVYYFYYLLRHTPFSKIESSAAFWFNTSLFIYFGFSLMTFVFSTYILQELSQAESMTLWSFHNINNILKNLLFAVGIYVSGK